MNKIFLILLGVLAALPTILLAQISEGGLPPSYSSSNLKSTQTVPETRLQSINITELLNEDINSYSTPFRYGIVENVELDIKSGLKTKIDNGYIWQYTISSDSAKSIKLMFDEYLVPSGAKLFVYNSDYSVIYGAFTSANVNADSSFVIADFPGTNLILEYYEPSDADFSGTLTINKISQAYRDLNELFTEEVSDEDDDSTDYVDVNCDEGLEWQLQKHAVCLYTFIDEEDMSEYLCSGALINNVNNDGTPYFLTANHCVSSSSSAQSVVAYFNYETEGCGLDYPSYTDCPTLTDASLLTTGDESDFTLLEFTSEPTSEYQAYYAGWDLTDSAEYTVGIHHPEGGLKKISIDDDPPVTYASQITWSDDEGTSTSTTPANTHWQVYFDKGATGSGSSGSPLFNQDKRIIGQLHGGGDDDDYYGKLNYSWDNSSSSEDLGIHQPGTGGGMGNITNYDELYEYLAGDENTTTSIDGYYPSTNLPEAVFAASSEEACVGSSVQFTDYSVFDVTSWEWEFTPSTITYLDSTNDYSQNPVISFDEEGSYDVKLIVENNNGKDTVTHTISAVYTLSISYESDMAGSCLSDVDTLEISATGADTYTWELDSTSSIYFSILSVNDNKVSIIKNNDTEPDSTIYVTGTVVGSQNGCTGTSYFSVKLVKQFNDDIANALLIESGENGPYSNTCATIEDNEPVPPVGECVSQSAWCDEYRTGEDVVENSVWFYFEGTSSGTAAIEATGMDGQIALYEADSYENVLNGDYTLLAANDDISNFNYNSQINAVSISSGQKYWLQFDGNAGAEGEFYITLSYSNAVSSLTTNDESTIILYPQPASDYIVAESNLFKGLDDIRVNIYNNIGELVYTDEADVIQNEIKIDFGGSSLSQGIYFISFMTENHVYSQRFIKTNE